MMDSKIKIFKPFHIINIVLVAVLLLGVVYLKYDGQYEDRYIYLMGAGLTCLLIWEIYSQYRFDYLIKISRDRLHYKNDKIVIDIKDIESFTFIPTISYTPSKFILETKKGEVVLELQNYNRPKLKKISDALKERMSTINE